MLHAIKQQFFVEWSGWVAGLATLLAASGGGMLMMYMIVKFSDEKEYWVATGTILGAAMLAIYILIMIGAGIAFNFNLEVSMGCTRRHFLVSFYIVNILFSITLVLVLLGVYKLESAVAAVLYPDLEMALNLWPYLIRGGIPAVLFIITVAGFCGGLVMRFGMRAFWVIWAIWMFGFLGVPNLSNVTRDAPDSLLGRIGTQSWQLIASVPAEVWIVLAVIVSVACFAGTWLIVRKQQVTL